ncbi:MAG: flagellar basal body-associated FliL family protein [Acidobacteriota bacterium]
MPDDELDMEEPQPTEGEEAPKSKRKWIFLALAIVVLLVAGIAGIWAGGLLEPAQVEAETKGPAKKAPPLEVNQVVNLDPVIVNLLGTTKMSYARIAVALGLHNNSPGSQIFREDVMVPKIKDELLSSVGQMTPADLLRPEAKDQLKKQIKLFVNNLLEKGSGEVVEVYFTDFIVQ